ncbi:uncharacterized protein LOC142177647 [Nicotiana tabacum]|uniref:Uncharacterized protein LOC142177647 n=1 Tax=Nicotiana tabacum TaxID=4097 RepID=A0AC58U0R3_TOBAC
MGDLHSSAWMHVIDAKTLYNILLGRSWIHKNKVVLSTYHQCLKYCEDGVEKKIVADDNPFTEAESYFADAKFDLKNYVSKEVKVGDVMLTKSVAKKVDVTTSNAKIFEKYWELYDRNKMNVASSRKKVTHVLCYVPNARCHDPNRKVTTGIRCLNELSTSVTYLSYRAVIGNNTRKVKNPSSEQQGNVLGDLTLPIKRIEAIKSSTKVLKGFVKSSNHNSLLNLALPTKIIDEGFDPNAYKLLAKVGYDPNEPSKLGKLPPKASNPTQKMTMDKRHPLNQSREGLGYKQPPPIRISITRASCNYITTKKVSTTLNKKPSVFDRLTKPMTSIFNRLGPLKKENKRHGSYKGIGAPIFAKKEILTKLVVSCGDVLKAKALTIVHIKKWEKDKESVGSSYHITIHDEQNASSYTEVEEKCLDIHVCHHISFNDGDPQEDEDTKNAPPELEKGVKITINALKEVNLRVVEDPKPTYVSASLTSDEESKYIELLKEFKDVFAWSYKEMPGLDPKVVVHHLAVKRGGHLVKQAQRRFIIEWVPLIETEVNKLIEAGFVREDEFPLPIPELMIDATTGYEAMSFMDGSSGYNQICMAPKDKDLTAFLTPKGIYCYKTQVVVCQRWLVPPPNDYEEEESEVEHLASVLEVEIEDWRQPLIDYLCYGDLLENPRRKTEI